ncbi:UDP-2,3-diacylglucosamine diphosphatase [Oceanobacter mangrovi]|uniref:UDP-2,3-diacylglucosamine diphosphatase n=1 Tax=Oceanobacter mangrovi TaxID=2862510 RepID=UPI001C8DF771|nr:UDP-2,3-diacylglucosamine diphosphatase [Oceanobacter mangrovi]
MAVYFISDLHLSPELSSLTAGFVRYLDSLEDADSLYILGDFFEAWIGDDAVTPLSSEVEQALKRLSERQCSIYLMHGNRDFLIGSDFCQRAGCQLINEGSVIELGDQAVVLLHGDSLCTDDTAYQQVRQMLRNPAWQQQFLAKTIAERIEFARQARQQSQQHGQMTSDEIMDVNPDAVNQALDSAGVELMIHGHTHRPACHQWQADQQSRQRWVLGDWSETKGWDIRWTAANGLELREFSLS